MATPSFRFLHEHLGENATFTALGRPHLLELLSGNPWFHDAIPFEVHGKRPEFHQKAVTSKLRQAKFDAIVLFPNSFRAAMIAWLGGVPQRIGYGREGRSFLLSHFAKHTKNEIPLVDFYLALAERATEAISGQAMTMEHGEPDRRTELFITPEEEKLGDEIWQTLGLKTPDKVVVLNVCSANNLIKQWPVDYAVELSKRIARELDMDVLLNCGPDEQETVRDLARRTQSPRVFTMADLPLNVHTGKICMQRARVTVSADSGPLHMALALGKPAMVLLGPTSKTYIANPTLDQTVLSRHLPCSPCQARLKCPESHHRCIMELTPDMVFEKMVEMLNQRPLETAN